MREGDRLGDVIGDLRVDGDAGEGLFEIKAGFFEGGWANVDGLVEQAGLGGGGGAEEDAGFGRGAGAELDDGDFPANGGKNSRGAFGEDSAFGAGEIVLGELGNLLEEEGAGFVVEEPGREAFGVGGEADEGCFCYGGEGAGDGGLRGSQRLR